MIRVFLDGNLIKESPKGLTTLKGSIKYDQNLKGRILAEDEILYFYRDGYDYLKSLDAQGFCAEVKIIIEEDIDETSQWEVIHDGVIHLPACIFNIEPYNVKCPVDDNSWFARINKNKNIKFSIVSDRSKNDQPIVPAVHSLITFFRPSTGAYSYANRWVYPAREIFRYLIEAMSDGEVEFASNTFSALGQYADLGIALGYELRVGLLNGHNKQPVISFADFFKEVDKKYNLQIQSEATAGGKPVIRIEAAQDFFLNTTSMTLDKVRNISQRVDAGRLYASIKAGSEKTDDSSGAVQYPETTRWLTFRSEQYPSLGQCNIDSELDLVSSYIISSNVIEQIVVNNLPDYDDDVVMIEIDWLNAKPKRTNWLVAGPPYFYNEGLKNDAVITRWLNGIPSSIANFLGTNNDARFRVGPNTDQFQSPAIHAGGSQGIGPSWNNDFTPSNFDPNNYFGGTTVQGNIITSISQQFYSAPQGGFYTFSSFLDTIIHNHSFGSSANFWGHFERYNSSGVLISSSANYFVSIPPGITQNYPMLLNMHASFLLNTGDRVKAIWKVANQNLNNPALNLDLTIKKESYFKCDFTSFGGGVWATVDDADFLCILFQFKYPLSLQQWNLMKANMSQAIFFNVDGLTNYKGWLENVSYNRDKDADITIRSSHRLKP